MPKVSVIITAFNARSYLQQSLTSAYAQSYSDYEIIILDDGSTDGSREDLRSWIDMDKKSLRSDGKEIKCRLFEHEYNEGIPVSRNRAIYFADGDYIAIHDADDISLQHRLRDQAYVLDTRPEVGFLGSHAVKISQTGKTIGQMSYPPAHTAKAFTHITKHELNPIIDPSCMFRKKIFWELGGYAMTYNYGGRTIPLRHSMDFDLWCRMLLAGVQMTNLQYPCIRYRMHDSSISKIQNDEMRIIAREICARFARRSIDNPVIPKSHFFEDRCLREYKGK